MIREHPMIRVRLFKKRRNEVKVDPKLGGQWKVPCLGAMEGSMLGGQWKVKEKHLFTSSHFPPTKFI